MDQDVVTGQEVTGLKDKEASDESAQTWPLRRVGLRVHDIAASVEYYTQLGFAIVRDERDQQGGGSVGLGVGNQEILSLRALPGGHPRERSMAFYQALGMNVTVGIPGQADFLSWDGYHHHLGINLWAGRNVPPVEPNAYGIDFYEIKREGLAPVTMQDPDGVTVLVK